MNNLKSIKPKSLITAFKRNRKTVNGYPKTFIPFRLGKPKRDQLINNRDIENLRIALNTNITWKEFFNLI